MARETERMNRRLGAGRGIVGEVVWRDGEDVEGAGRPSNVLNRSQHGLREGEDGSVGLERVGDL